MTTPESDLDNPVNPADVAEDVSLTRDAPVTAPPDIPLEAPEADVLEQSVSAAPGEHQAARDLPLESDDMDAAEQAAVIEDDPDEYR